MPRHSLTALALTAVIALAGCTAPTGAPAAGGSQAAAPASSATGPMEGGAATPTQQGAPSAADPAPSTVESASPAAPADQASALPTLASRVVGKQTITLNDVTVRGGTTTVNFTVSNQGSSSHQVASQFGEGGTGDWTTSGVYIIDSKNAKRYLPARNAEKKCVCSNELAAVNIKPGESVVLSGVYKAIPDDVQTVSVFIPTAGTFDNVKVTR